MKIVSAHWTPKVNYLDVECHLCKKVFSHRADRWWLYCPSCGQRSKTHLGTVRDTYLKATEVEK